MEKKLKDLEEEAKKKEADYREKVSKANQKRQELLQAKQEKASRSSKPNVSLLGAGQNPTRNSKDNDGARSNSMPATRNRVTKHLSSHASTNNTHN